MLTVGTKRGSLAALAVLLLALVALTGGAAMVQVQAQAQTLDGGAATLTPGPEASPQEELLAEALGAMVQAGFNPADFDLEKAVFDPLGRAILFPIKSDLLELSQLPTFAGLLYVKETLTIQDKIVLPGLYPIYITQVVLSPQKSSQPPSVRPFVPILPPEGWVLCEIYYTVGLTTGVQGTITYIFRNPACMGNQGPNDEGSDGGDNGDDGDDSNDVINDNATVGCLVDPTLPWCQ